MSMTAANAAIYVARILGGAGDSNIRARATEAIADTFEELMMRNDWSFALTDTAQTFTVAGCHTGGVLSATLQTTTSNGFASCLQGMTITGTGITAGTTVSAMIAGSTTTLTMSTTANIAQGSAITCTFGGTIPIIQGTASYNLPTRFWKPYDCRLVSTQKWGLVYIHHREWDLQSYDQSQQGAVTNYTLYNPTLFSASGTQQAQIKFFRTPAANDVALLKYYRVLDATADPLDIPDEYLNTLLLMAQTRLLLTKNATDERIPIMMQKSEMRLRQMIARDRNEGGEDEYEGFHTPDEAAGPWRGDPFYPRGDYGW